jgi:outer membrane protein assembly factor BamB
VGSLDGNLYCLDANSGAVLWKFQTGGPIEATPAIDSTGAYFSTNTPGNDATFYKLDPNTGSVIWQDSVPYNWQLSAASFVTYGGIDASPTLAPDMGMVFLRTMFVGNYGINSTNGNILWVYNSTTNAAGTFFQAGGVPQVQAPLYAYGAIYINDYYSISCINATNGARVWSTYLSREDISQGISYAYGRIYVVDELGVLYVLNAQTGAKDSYYSFGYQMHCMPTLYNGYLYVGTNDWNVYCFGDARLMSSSSSAAAVAAPVSSLQAQTSASITPANAASTPIAEYAAVTAAVASVAVVAAVVAVTVILKRSKRK